MEQKEVKEHGTFWQLVVLCTQNAAKRGWGESEQKEVTRNKVGEVVEARW